MGAPGCDDAPIVTVPLNPRVAKRFTLIMPYYENPGFLTKQIELWRGLVTPALHPFVDLIIVDDGSPHHPAADVLLANAPLPMRTKHFRIDVDVRWNWLAARNIGAHHASIGWIALTDMDHMLTTPTLETLVFGDHDESFIYRFSRTEHTGQRIHPHPNSWFMTRAMYWAVGGHDEALSGYYGTDGDYRRRCARTAPIRIMDVPLVRYERLGDSSTVHYLRKQPEDRRAKQMMKARTESWKPKTLSFPYHEVAL